VEVVESIAQPPLMQYIETAGVVVRIKTLKTPPAEVGAPAATDGAAPKAGALKVVSAEPAAPKEELPALPRFVNGELFPMAEIEPRAEAEPGVEAEREVEAEPGVDVEREVEAEPEVEAEREVEAELDVEREAVVGPGADVEPGVEAEREVGVEPEAVVEADTVAEAEPAAVEEPMAAIATPEEPTEVIGDPTVKAEEPAVAAEESPATATQEPAPAAEPDPLPGPRPRNRRATAGATANGAATASGTAAKAGKAAKPAVSKRGRKSLKQVSAEADLIEIPADDVLFSKQYYTMGEVSEMFRVNQSLLRFWETEFDILQPRKNKKGDRYFRPVDIKNLHLIYHLLRQKKFTIEGAKDFLKKNKKAEERFEIVQRLQEIRSFLLEWKAQL
jgi:DNA-binding transcriptional MerR regulator